MKYALLVTFLLLVIPASLFADTTADRDSVWFHEGYWYSQTQLDSAIDRHEEWVYNVRDYVDNELDKEPFNKRYRSFFHICLNFNPYITKIDTSFSGRLEFRGDTLLNCEIFDKELSGIIINNSIIINCLFSRCEFEAADFSDTEFIKDINKAGLGNPRLVYEPVFYHSSLHFTRFIGTNFANCSIANADFEVANFMNATFNKVVFENVFLTDSKFFGIDQTSTSFKDCDLSGVNFRNANLLGLVYEPKVNPHPSLIVNAFNIDRIKYNDNPAALVQLKKQMRDAGFINSEKKIIAALRRHNAAWYETMLFDYSCSFGSEPFKPLKYMFGLFIFMGLFNSYVLFAQKTAGFYIVSEDVVLNKDNIQDFEKNKIGLETELFSDPRLFLSNSAWSAIRVYLIGFSISLLSALRIGFREVNLSNWVKLILPWEIDIKAYGYPRTISGIQSLFSVYMLALTILSYFGRPFDIG